MAPDGEIYVTDGYGNSLVHRFSAAGEHISSWGTPGDGPGEFITPHAVWIDQSDRVLVADRENNRVQLFNRAGTYLGEWRGPVPPHGHLRPRRRVDTRYGPSAAAEHVRLGGRLTGRGRPALNGAHGIWGDRQGNIFLAEMIPSRITKLVPIDLPDDAGY